MSNQQRARLPPTPSNPMISQVGAAPRHPQNIDVQNNTIATVVTTTDSGQVHNNNNINDESLNALGPELATQTSRVLQNLSDQERTIILEVLSRDESIRQRDSARIM
jgi:ABC-type histidine transport system ATPase subunit